MCDGYAEAARQSRICVARRDMGPRRAAHLPPLGETRHDDVQGSGDREGERAVRPPGEGPWAAAGRKTAGWPIGRVRPPRRRCPLVCDGQPEYRPTCDGENKNEAGSEHGLMASPFGLTTGGPSVPGLGLAQLGTRRGRPRRIRGPGPWRTLLTSPPWVPPTVA